MIKKMTENLSRDLSIDKGRLDLILNAMQHKIILIVGDLMLDHYIYGSVTRISPEAPVPVVDIQREVYRLGGAGNVTKNIVSLGATPVLCSVVGSDPEGMRLLDILKDCGISTADIWLGTKPTITKTRIIAHTQQVVRLDQEDRSPITEKEKSYILQTISNYNTDIDAVIISDYAKGVISVPLIRSIRSVLSGLSIPICVDPKQDIGVYDGVDLITPNMKELSTYTGLPINSYDDLIKAASVAARKSRNVLVTRGEHGMTLYEETNDVINIPSVARHVYDVTGAGDTVIAVATLAMVSGADLWEAAVIANAAAGIVVSEVGAAAVTVDQLREALS